MYGPTGGPPWWTQPFGYDALPFAGIDLTVILLVTGLWLVTSAERYAPADERDRARRLGLRLIAVAIVIATIIVHITINKIIRNLFSARNDPMITLLWQIFWTLVTLSFVTMPFLLFGQFRSLAKRARSAHLMEHCTIVGLGASLSIAFLLLMGLTYAYPERLHLPADWTTQSDVSMGLMLIGSTGALLFLLWSVYLLARFTISFHIAARAMQRKWDRDDRSVSIAPEVN